MCEKESDKICNCCAVGDGDGDDIDDNGDNSDNGDNDLDKTIIIHKQRDLLNSTPWFDASIALQQIRKVS